MKAKLFISSKHEQYHIWQDTRDTIMWIPHQLSVLIRKTSFFLEASDMLKWIRIEPNKQTKKVHHFLQTFVFLKWMVGVFDHFKDTASLSQPPATSLPYFLVQNVWLHHFQDFGTPFPMMLCVIDWAFMNTAMRRKKSVQNYWKTGMKVNKGSCHGPSQIDSPYTPL